MKEVKQGAFHYANGSPLASLFHILAPLSEDVRKEEMRPHSKLLQNSSLLTSCLLEVFKGTVRSTMMADGKRFPGQGRREEVSIIKSTLTSLL